MHYTQLTKTKHTKETDRQTDRNEGEWTRKVKIRRGTLISASSVPNGGGGGTDSQT